MAKIYPRLESFEYKEKISFVENQLSSKGKYDYVVTDADLHWLPMGNRVELKELETLRSNIIDFISSEGLRPAASAQARTAFDRKLGLKLREWLDITPSIAADTGMWAYMNIMLVPELIRLRWGYTEKGEARTINHERYYDTNRAYLKKLWLTAYMINDTGLYLRMKQDEIDIWYDKAFNRGQDKYIQCVFTNFYKNIEAFNITAEVNDLYRQFFKVVNRKLAYINWYALLDSSGTDKFLDDCFKTAYENFKESQEAIRRIIGTEFSDKTKNVVSSIKSPAIEAALKRLRTHERHSLEEDFTSLVPRGFILAGIPFENTNSWSDLFSTFISYLAKKAPEQTRTLADNPRLFSKSGSRYFSVDFSKVRENKRIMDNFYIETNLSANDFVRLIGEVLDFFKISRDKFEIYLQN